jgi:hypothetical protein
MGCSHADHLRGGQASGPQFAHTGIPGRLTELLAARVMDERVMHENRCISASQHACQRNLPPG